MLIYGNNCLDERFPTHVNCNGRHVFIPSDRIHSGHLRKGARIAIEIVTENSPLSYAVRVIQCKRYPDNDWQPYVQFPRDEFEKTFRYDKEKPPFHRGHRVGFFGVVWIDNRPQRCRMCKIFGDEATVHLIDLYEMKKFKLCDIAFLPDRYHSYPWEIQHLVIAGFEPKIPLRRMILPYSEMIKSQNTEFSIECEVVLHLRSLLMVSDMKLYNGNGEMALSMRSALISLGMATENMAGIEHMESLKRENGNALSIGSKCDAYFLFLFSIIADELMRQFRRSQIALEQ